ncbi:hypothetical protein O6H91_12G034500 [Diphasiastrum complanatum]|uniref:Uncharacterized protein n=1 Tax=Diphasiastrum complanatum TaxID=34168 RepID=A0ACC2C0R8_DIPCM|nr:hypothetical protein O6H91_12G034500 [Diphasiastrum complanatum]
MEDDWEAEDFVPPPPVVAKEQPKSHWDDEDAEVEEVKESWEDDDKTKVESAKTKPKPEKRKTDESKGKGSVATDEKISERKDEKLADPLAEKLRQQRLVEEADYRVTTELFGKSSSGQTLDEFIPKSEEDFLQYAELIGQKLRPFEKSFQYLTLLKAVMRSSVASLKAADAKEIASSLTVIANEKLKLEKEASTGKKKSGQCSLA